MDFLEVGKIINTHGLKGEVKIMPWTDTPDVFEDLEGVYLKKKGEKIYFTISSVRYQKNNLIVKFKELNDINEAEPLKNSILYAKREDLGELPEGVYYIADLIGFSVVKDTGEVLGKIKDVINTGANDIYVVERENNKDLLIPVIDGVVLSVDIEKGEAVVHLMEGLEDL